MFLIIYHSLSSLPIHLSQFKIALFIIICFDAVIRGSYDFVVEESGTEQLCSLKGEIHKYVSKSVLRNSLPLQDGMALCKARERCGNLCVRLDEVSLCYSATLGPPTPLSERSNHRVERRSSEWLDAAVVEDHLCGFVHPVN